tara:strand:+ start:263 stop:859 length:597 start_codon:yes stop_codon:yes gene_type:complete
VCNCGFNIININERIVGGFKNKNPISFDKITCFKKVLKNHGLNMTMLKKMANKKGVTLNEDFIHEITKKQASRKKKKKKVDVSVVDDTSDEEEFETRGRGRPKKENNKDNNDLMNDIINNNTDNENKEDICDSEHDDDDDEIPVIPFKYTGKQSIFLQMSLYIDEYNVVYNNLGEILGTFNHDRNEIVDRLAIVSPEC